jgi:hypothetical protein
MIVSELSEKQRDIFEQVIEEFLLYFEKPFVALHLMVKTFMHLTQAVYDVVKQLELSPRLFDHFWVRILVGQTLHGWCELLLLISVKTEHVCFI